MKRIAINLGGGYVPGLNSVLHGAVLASAERGWQLVGIRDGYDGVLVPERYPDGGRLTLTSVSLEHLAGVSGCVLGTASSIDPFHVRTVNADGAVEEADRSNDLLQLLANDGIDAVVSIADAHALSVLWKLHRKGLKTVCIPKSAENQVAATMLSFGYNSVLSFTVDMLDRARQAAQSSRKIGVVEVPGEHAGWLALQAATAICADAVLLPEIPYELASVATKLRAKLSAGRPYGMVIVAEGALPVARPQSSGSLPAMHPLRASLSPGSTGEAGTRVIERTGHAAESVARELQRLVNHETYPLTLGPLVKGGPPTAVDRQLGLAYGAAAMNAIAAGQTGVMVAFQPPDMKFVPLAEAINRIRTVPPDHLFIRVARSLGIALGD